MANIKINDRVLWDDPWRRDWGVPMDTREWTVFDVREDMVCICTGTLGSSGYAEAEVPPQELELIKAARLKAIAIKVVIIVARVVWIAMGFAITFYTMYVVAVVLGVCIPEGTSTWVRFVIGVPCIFIAPLCVELLYIAISRKVDRLSDYRVLNLRPLRK
jgi:cytochrome c biogenesis protein CcdA